MFRSKDTYSKFTKICIIFILMNSIGFPGNYTLVFGNKLGVFCEYLSFLLQLLLITTFSTQSAIHFKIFNYRNKYKVIYVYLIIIFITSLITTDSFKKELVSVIRYSITALFALWLIETYLLKDVIKLWFIAEIGIILSSCVFQIFFVGFLDQNSSYINSFTGIFTVKNNMAFNIVFSLCLTLLIFYIKREENENKGLTQNLFWLIYYTIFQIVLLVIAHSVGAIVSLIIVISFLFIYKRWSKKKLNIGLVYVVGSVGFLIITLTMLPLIEPIINSLGKDATLNGRIPLWNQALNVIINNKTFFGFGYGRFWFNEEAVKLMHQGFSEYSWAAHMRSGAHNALIELVLNIGLVGIISYLVLIIKGFKDSNYFTELEYYFCSMYMLLLMLHGLTERVFGTYDYNTLLVFICIGIGLHRSEEQRKINIKKAKELRLLKLQKYENDEEEGFEGNIVAINSL